MKRKKSIKEEKEENEKDLNESKEDEDINQNISIINRKDID